MLQLHSFKKKLDKNEDNNNIILNKQKKGKRKNYNIGFKKTQQHNKKK